MEVIRNEKGEPTRVIMTAAEFEKEQYTDVWTAERWDVPDWETQRKDYIGKRTWMPPCSLFGETCLLVEGFGFEIKG